MSIIHSSLLLGAGAAVGPVQIERSLRCNSSDSASLSRASYAGSGTFSCWVKRCKLGTAQTIISGVAFNASDQLNSSTAVFRDPSAWMHVLVSTSGTYVNGTSVASGSAITPGIIGSGCDLYLADIHFIDGQALDPSSFTTTDPTTGQLIPKAYAGTYGTNGFHLPFSDNSATTATTLGKDTSGNGNNWTPNNFSVQGISNYSSNVTTVATSIYNGTPATMFDGSTSTYYGVTSNNGSNSSITIDLTGKNVSVSSSVRVYGSYRTGMVWQINGSTVSSSGVTHPNTGWQTLSGWSAGAITSISVSVPSGSANEIYAIEINGSILTNNTGAGNDSLVDTPTSYGTDTGVGGSVRGNYATWNPLYAPIANTFTNGNLDVTTSVSGYAAAASTIGIASDKYYVEFTYTSNTASAGNRYAQFGIISELRSAGNFYIGQYAGDWGFTQHIGGYYSGGSTAISYGSTWDVGAILGLAIDKTNNKLYFSINGTWQNSANPAAGTGGVDISSVAAKTVYFVVGDNDGGSSVTGSINAGQRPFAYTAPSGFKALCDTNLPVPVVAKPSTVFDIVTRNGFGSAGGTVSSLSFAPDLIWDKPRSIVGDHYLFDAVRTVSKSLSSSTTSSESSYPNWITGTTSTGYTVGSSDWSAGTTVVEWCWNAGGSTVSNTQGSITSQVRANVSAGFSVVTWTSPSSGDYTIGHGLGVAPSLVITKSRSASGDQWYTFHRSVCTSTSNYLKLSSTDGLSTYAGAWGATLPTGTVVGLNAGGGFIPSSATAVAYCFAPVSGYSSFGSYSGNFDSNGPFVYTGFRPRFLLIKNSTDTTYAANYSWALIDTQRYPYNSAPGTLNPLWANRTYEENQYGSGVGVASQLGVDVLSNGFKLRCANAELNYGTTYIYAAFAENPFQYARAR